MNIISNLTLVFLLQFGTINQIEIYDRNTEILADDFVHNKAKKGFHFTEDDGSITNLLSSELYPFVNQYEMGQPLICKRVSGGEGVEIEAYPNTKDRKIKYIQYTFQKEKPELDSLINKYKRQGKTIQEISKLSLDELNNSVWSKKELSECYKSYNEYFKSKFGNSVAHKSKVKLTFEDVKKWENKNVTMLLYKQKQTVGIIVYWK